MARILIVDDSAMIRRNLTSILKQNGHEIVAEATNGMQALQEYQNLRPDLVTMDITMPVADGIESLEMIISRFPEAKIIMISALNQKEQVFTALRNGAKHYIVKPFAAEKVIEVVESVLKG